MVLQLKELVKGMKKANKQVIAHCKGNSCDFISFNPRASMCSFARIGCLQGGIPHVQRLRKTAGSATQYTTAGSLYRELCGALAYHNSCLLPSLVGGS
jgi:hypothetical protein